MHIREMRQQTMKNKMQEQQVQLSVQVQVQPWGFWPEKSKSLCSSKFSRGGKPSVEERGDEIKHMNGRKRDISRKERGSVAASTFQRIKWER
jgi:hypothetical protein